MGRMSFSRVFPEERALGSSGYRVTGIAGSGSVRGLCLCWAERWEWGLGGPLAVPTRGGQGPLWMCEHKSWFRGWRLRQCVLG